jgi:hypothetical protein
MRFRLSAMLALGAFTLVRPGVGHHSFPGVYDTSQQLVLEGVTTEFMFRNPHAFIIIEVTSADGHTEQWDLELPPAVALSRGGMTANAVRPGDELLVTCNPARDGARTCGLGQRGGFYRSSDNFLYGRDPRMDSEQ